MADSFLTPEDLHLYNNQTWSSAGKFMLDAVLCSYRSMSALQCVALRLMNVYGPRIDLHGNCAEVSTRWAGMTADGQPPLIFGDDTQTMDFIHIDQVARATVPARASHLKDHVFNVASETETSLNGLAARRLTLMGSDLRPQFSPEQWSSPMPRCLADTSAAERSSA